MSPSCDLDLKNSNPFFLHDTPAYDDVSPCQVWVQKVWQFRRYCPNKHQLIFIIFIILFFNVQCNLDLAHSNPILSMEISAYVALPSD